MLLITFFAKDAPSYIKSFDSELFNFDTSSNVTQQAKDVLENNIEKYLNEKFSCNPEVFVSLNENNTVDRIELYFDRDRPDNCNELKKDLTDLTGLENIEIKSENKTEKIND